MIELKEGRVSARIASHNSTATAENQIHITGQQAPPVGQYEFFRRNGTVITFSGFGSRDEKLGSIGGRVGYGNADKILEYGKKAARGACLNMINNLARGCDGDLDGVKDIDITVLVNSSPDFKQHPKVADGASQLLREVFGNYVGRPVRMAAGASALPNDMTVEIKGQVFITDQLAAQLDLLDAKRLATTLINTETMLGRVSRDDFLKKEAGKLLKAAVLSEADREQLQHYAISALKALLHIDDDAFQQALAACTQKEFFTAANPPIASRQDLIDRISYEAQEVRLDIRAARPTPLLERADRTVPDAAQRR